VLLFSLNDFKCSVCKSSRVHRQLNLPSIDQQCCAAVFVCVYANAALKVQCATVVVLICHIRAILVQQTKMFDTKRVLYCSIVMQHIEKHYKT
jgi:hypothetical protein